jgi:hypothetical protein
MSAAQETYRASVASAHASRDRAVAAAETQRQATVDASNSFVGYNLQTGNYANFVAAVNTANAAKLKALNDAEVAKQAAIAVARETLRNATGEYGY